MATESGMTSDEQERKPVIVAVYKYVDEQSSMLFEKVRYRNPDGTKEFVQRRKVTARRYEYNLDGVRRVLYNLPDIMAAQAAGNAVFLCEGEKDADRLKGLGLAATTNTEGACETEGKWRKEYTEVLKPCKVVILQDNDAAGRKHANTVAKVLHAAGTVVKLVELPDLPVKGDISDWLDKDHTLDELLQVVKETPVWRPLTLVETAVGSSTDPSLSPTNWLAEQRQKLKEFTRLVCTDASNGLRFQCQYGEEVIYVHGVGWFCWNGKHWEHNAEKVTELAKMVANTIRDEAENYTGKQRAKVIAWAERSANTYGYGATLNAARSLPGIMTSFAELDSNPMLLNVQNGVIDLATGELLPHARQHKCSKILDIKYDPDAKAPRWMQFLHESMSGYSPMIKFLQRGVGYSLTGLTSAQVFFLCYGPGGRGKSRFLNAIRTLLGSYAASAGSRTFMKNITSGTSDLARLAGARFIGVGEVEDGRWNAALIKEFSGEDIVTAAKKFQPEIEFLPVGKLWFRSNVRPKVDADDSGFWRRVLVIPFVATVSEDNKDEHLDRKLQAEMEGILAWAVEGCLEWQKEGLMPPDTVSAAITDYQESIDDLGQFLVYCCVRADWALVPAKQLYASYLKWCDEYGHEGMNGTKFGQRIRAIEGVEAKRWGDGVRYRGLGLKAEFQGDEWTKDMMVGPETTGDSEYELCEESAGGNTDTVAGIGRSEG